MRELDSLVRATNRARHAGASDTTIKTLVDGVLAKAPVVSREQQAAHRISERRKLVAAGLASGRSRSDLAAELGVSSATITGDARALGEPLLGHGPSQSRRVARRHKKVLAMWSAGADRAMIAKALNTTTKIVSNDIEKMRAKGVDVPRRNTLASPAALEDRRRAVTEMWQQGMSTTEIAEMLSIKPTTVSSTVGYLRANGVDLPHRRPTRRKPRQRQAR